MRIIILLAIQQDMFIILKTICSNVSVTLGKHSAKAVLQKFVKKE